MVDNNTLQSHQIDINDKKSAQPLPIDVYTAQIWAKHLKCELNPYLYMH